MDLLARFKVRQGFHRRSLSQYPPNLISADFRLGLQLSKLLSFKEEVRVLKTSLSPLKGTLKYSIHQNDICLSIETNQPIYVCSNRKLAGTHSFIAIELYGTSDFTVKNYSNDSAKLLPSFFPAFRIPQNLDHFLCLLVAGCLLISVHPKVQYGQLNPMTLTSIV